MRERVWVKIFTELMSLLGVTKTLGFENFKLIIITLCDYKVNGFAL